MVASATQFTCMVHALDMIPLGSTDVDMETLCMFTVPLGPSTNERTCNHGRPVIYTGGAWRHMNTKTVCTVA